MKRKREYGMTKNELIMALYKIQEPICPLCKRSILQELQIYLMWREKKTIKGMRVKRKDANLNIDHIIAVSKGGTDDLENLALTHRRCNDIRGSVQIYDRKPKRVVE